MQNSFKTLEKHDYPCCNIDGIYHITISATETLCGKKWKYMPTKQNFKWTQQVQRLCFLAPNEISCEDCLKIQMEKETTEESFTKK